MEKKKTLASALLLLFFGLLAGGSIITGELYELWYWGIGFALIFFIGLAISVNKEKEKQEERERRRKEARERRRKELEVKKHDYELKKKEQIAKMGEADKVISLEEYDIDQEIAIFGKTGKIILLGKEYSFSDILECTYEDDIKTIKGKTEYTSTTTTKNGNAVGRAIVGGVLAGGAGAIVGGATAKKETQTLVHQKNDIIIHNYTVIVNVNNLTNPVITIPLRSDKDKLNEIVGLLNLIIKRGEK